MLVANVSWVFTKVVVVSLRVDTQQQVPGKRFSYENKFAQ